MGKPAIFTIAQKSFKKVVKMNIELMQFLLQAIRDLNARIDLNAGIDLLEHLIYELNNDLALTKHRRNKKEADFEEADFEEDCF